MVDAAKIDAIVDAVDKLSSRFDAMAAKDAEKPKPEDKDKEGRSKPPDKWTPETARKRVGGTFGT